MAVILCTWEFGSNLGHLNQLKLPITIALEQGHTVYLATKELHRVKEVFGELPIRYLQAPYKVNSIPPAKEVKFLSLTHILQHQILDKSEYLESTILAWRTLFDLVKPDLVIYETSFLALVASRDYSFKKISIGNGFAVPPKPQLETDPFAVFLDTPKTFEAYRDLKKDDTLVLDKINKVLNSLGGTSFSHISEIYSQVDDTFLMTLPILDHFGERKTKYLGIAPPSVYNDPIWPSTEGVKIFVYLNNIPSIESLMYSIKLSNLNALLYIKDLPKVLRDRYSSPKIKFIDSLVDLSKVCEQVDWVISHGNHSTTVEFVLKGIPQLLLPHQQ